MFPSYNPWMSNEAQVTVNGLLEEDKMRLKDMIDKNTIVVPEHTLTKFSILQCDD
jgi:hypothetical protein